jgi:integrase
MRRIPNVFNKEQLVQLLRVIDEPDLMMAVLLGLFCGLRNGEVCRLRVQEVDLSTNKLRVADGKNPNKGSEGYGKDRIVTIPQCLVDTLKKYRGWLGQEETYMFPSTNLPGRHMHSNDLSRRFKLALHRAGLNVLEKVDSSGHKRNVYRFHTLRHTFATLLWEKTGDVLSVKHALGHSKIETTLVYTHITNKVVEEKINTAFGLGKPSISATVLDPIGVLMRRLAHGEIDVPTFQRLRNALREQQMTEYIG